LQDGQLKVEREKVVIETPELDPSLIFEQDPVQILDALLPLYMNSCLLRSLQEALASELAARMNAMNSATDNAKELRKVLLVKFNKQRQAKITQEISEIVAGANATN
jgi:F-type H+-transporting ATPase subunit gamma